MKLSLKLLTGTAVAFGCIANLGMAAIAQQQPSGRDGGSDGQTTITSPSNSSPSGESPLPDQPSNANQDSRFQNPERPVDAVPGSQSPNQPDSYKPRVQEQNRLNQNPSGGMQSPNQPQSGDRDRQDAPTTGGSGSEVPSPNRPTVPSGNQVTPGSEIQPATPPSGGMQSPNQPNRPSGGMQSPDGGQNPAPESDTPTNLRQQSPSDDPSASPSGGMQSPNQPMQPSGGTQSPNQPSRPGGPATPPSGGMQSPNQPRSGAPTPFDASSVPSDSSSLSVDEILGQSREFELLNALIRVADQNGALTRTLAGKSYTIFAPTDSAFLALPEGTFTKLVQPENRGLLMKVLSYHIVPKQVTSTEIQSGTTASLEGEPLTLQTGAGVTVNGAQVVQPDIKADDGVIHAIDRVILPPDVQSQLGGAPAASVGN